MNSLLLFIAAISHTAFSIDKILSSVLDIGGTIGDTCGDCYRLQLLNTRGNRDEDSTSFTYKLSVKKKADGSCKQLGEISLGLDNYCARSLTELEGLISFDFGDFAPGNSQPTATFSTTTAKKEILEIFLDLKHKIDPGDYQIFTLFVAKDRTKRSNTDDNLLGFRSTNGLFTETCYIDVTHRSLPELCRPPRLDDPVPTVGQVGFDRTGPGEFIGCESRDNNCDVGVCAAELDGIRGNPCDGGKDSVYSKRDNGDIDGKMWNAVCVEVRSTGCETDDDCESEDRCFTKLGTITNADSGYEDRPYKATCPQKVCGSTNFN